jgi:tetratricopeptide (TPR) repeat protein
MPTSLPGLRTAVRRNPEDTEALDALGLALTERGEYERSAVVLRAAVERSPHKAIYLHHLSNALLACGNAEEAAWRLERALEIDSRAEFWQALGAVYLDHLNRRDDAFHCFCRAIQLAPKDPLNYRSAARCWLNGAEPKSVNTRLRTLLPPDTDLLQTRRGVAGALQESGRYEEALAVFHDIVCQYRDDSASLCSMAQLYSGMHDLQSAEQYFEQALLAGGKDREILVGYLLHWARLGDLGRARHFYRSRMRDLPVHFENHRSADIWEGQDIRGKTVRFIAGDIYFGDALQFIRFARVAKEAGANVIIQGPKRIRHLLWTAPGVDLVVAPRDPVPPFEYQGAVFWLLFSLQAPVEEMLGRSRYLQAPKELRTEWRNRLRRTPGFNVGVVWHGSAYNRLNRYACRSMPLEDLRPLAAIPGLNLYSLQVGPGREQLTAADPPFPAIDLAPDFPNAAAAIEELDLVVTIDTSIAHLAGALGKLTYVMLPYDACFRWMLDRDDTPWYPNMRLFRQAKPGHWPEVVAAVCDAVGRLTGGNASP